MCGRFALHLPHRRIRQVPGRVHAEVREWVDEDEFVPRYNIAPRTYSPVIRRRDPGPSGSNDDLVMHSMKWGLVPSWAQVEDNKLNTINAKSENLLGGTGMWEPIKGKQRCIVLCQGYYEWLLRDKHKLPHFVKHQSGDIMLLAGLYESTWLKDQTKPLWSFTIVTTEANEDFMWLHDRQPVILSTKEAVDTWLDTSSQEWSPDLAGLIGPYKDTSAPLQCYQVPLEVGKVGKESPSFIEPVENRKDGIEALFSKQKAKGAVVPQTPQKGKRKRSMSSEATLDDEPIIIIDDGNEEGIGLTTPKKKGRLTDEGKAESSGGASQSQDETTQAIEQLSLANLPCTPTKPKQRPMRTPSPKKPRTSPVKPYSPTKPKPAKGHGSAKITSFFNKAT